MTDWMDRAACKAVKVDVFYERDTRFAREVCRACHSLAACRKWGDETETPFTTFGFLAGETESQRVDRRAGRVRNLGPRPIKHGTRSGYQSHLSRGEIPCDRCSAADLLYVRVIRARKVQDGMVEVSHIDRRTRQGRRLAS